jgi:glycosyltransferase involved in cell wall biosynthesis
MEPTIAVIIATYNWPRALELVLWGYAVQTDRRFRVIVADDGSGPETAETIARMRTATALDITHIWHEDRGWRKSEILNRAIVAARDAYLIFTDGDTIPRDDFVAVHRRVAERGVYAAGMTIRLTEGISAAVTTEDVLKGRVTDRAWLVGQGMRLGRHAIRFSRDYIANRWLDWTTTSRRRFRGLNGAAWRDDLLRVNGFDITMPYGGMDAELGDRLDNLGLRHRRLRFRAMTVHLWHKRPWREDTLVAANREYRALVRGSGRTITPLGIAELAPLAEGECAQRRPSAPVTCAETVP